MNKLVLTSVTLALVIAATHSASAESAGERELLWGDTHLHTSYSPDVYLMGNRSEGPDTAYRYAKGEPVIHPLHRGKVQIQTPLDFLVVSDHAEYMGVIPKVFEGDPLVANTETGKRWKKFSDEGNPQKAFGEAIAQVNRGESDPDLNSKKVRKTVWHEIVEAAEKHNQPGKFTSFIGWEWSSTPDGANLHRVVIQKDGSREAKRYLPFSSFDSAKPEELWKWLSKTSKKARTDFLAIPHNQNISKGLMFPLEDSNGKALDAQYARTRMRWEPIVEMTQIKGDSETHPQLSPTDEFADYETYDHVIESGERKDVAVFGEGFRGMLSDDELKYLKKKSVRLAKAGDYTRSGLLRGMAFMKRIGENPFKFGMIGSTDAHTSLPSAEEDNFWGKMALDGTPENTLDPQKLILPPSTYGADMGAAGLAAVWAKENTREAIFEAFQRKETYATTGPRIRLRFFGGYDFTAVDASTDKLAEIGYAEGVPMGGDLEAASEGKAPTFLIQALKDPKHGNLDRIQIVKGWIDKDGLPQEKVYNVAASDGRKISKSGKLAPVGNTVDIKTASWTNTIGDTELKTAWTDPDFEVDKSAFYYVRVLQIPTPRHTLYDAVALGRKHPKKLPATIQERAYSSPIWYTP